MPAKTMPHKIKLPDGRIAVNTGVKIKVPEGIRISDDAQITVFRDDDVVVVAELVRDQFGYCLCIPKEHAEEVARRIRLAVAA